MKKRLLSILLVCILVLGLTGCGESENNETNNIDKSTSQTGTSENEEKTFKVGSHTLKYGYYKAGVTTEGVATLKLMEDGTCTLNAVDCTYTISDNLITVEYSSENYSGAGARLFRVDKDNEVCSVDRDGNIYEILPYYEVN